MDGFAYGSYNINIQLPLNRENDDLMVDVRSHVGELRQLVEDFYKRKEEERGGRELFIRPPTFDVKWEYHAREARPRSPTNIHSPGHRGDPVI
jgi:hypothetical protein